MSSGAPVLFDALGPRGRRRVLVASILAGLAFAGVIALVIVRLADKHQLDSARWDFVTQSSTWRFLGTGLLNTLKVALVAGLLSVAIGAVMALGRLSRSRVGRGAATLYVQFWRAVPLLLLIFFISLGFPVFGWKFPAFWFLVIGLTLYNSAVFAELFRAGILSLESGQTEAGLAVGLTNWQTMRLIVLPQAIRRMVPALVRQYVTLLKDSSLGFVIPYTELLRRGQITGQFYRSVLQTYMIVAVIYIAVNATLSFLARRLDRWQRRREGPGAPGAPGMTGVAVPDALTFEQAVAARPAVSRADPGPA